MIHKPGGLLIHPEKRTWNHLIIYQQMLRDVYRAEWHGTRFCLNCVTGNISIIRTEWSYNHAVRHYQQKQMKCPSVQFKWEKSHIQHFHPHWTKNWIKIQHFNRVLRSSTAITIWDSHISDNFSEHQWK